MPRTSKNSYWTRKLELELVEFIRQRDSIWRPAGNTNHHIQQKYRAYAEFAAKLGRGFTARSVRDRWVNIRSTFNHNLRKVEKSKATAQSAADVFVPCWPLWRPLQFLHDVSKKEDARFDIQSQLDIPDIKQEYLSEMEDITLFGIRQQGRRTNRPRSHGNINPNSQCKQLLDDLIVAMSPIASGTSDSNKPYWFFGKHVTERLNAMRPNDAERACEEIMALITCDIT